jgi:DNA-binding CsgD family transcriptional regulator
MTRLAARDFAALATFARDLDERADGDLGSPATLDSVLSLIPADGLEWGVTSIRRREIIELRHYPPLVVLPAGHPVLEVGREAFWNSWAGCPLCGAARQRRGGVVRLSDVPELDAAHPQHYQCIGIDVRHQLNVFVHEADLDSRHLFLSRAPGLDFSERDRQVLELARVFILQEARHLDAVRAAHAALAAFEADERDDARALLILGRGGAIEMMSAAGYELLHRYFGWAPNPRLLPAPVEAWMAEGDLAERIGGQRSATPPLRRVGPGGELVIRSVRDSGRTALVLTEHRTAPVEARSSLTRREREIVDAVAEGLSNVEIADRFGISAATVAKHLEHVFAKLEVANRAAAVARAAAPLNG